MRNNASITGHRRAAYYGAPRSYLATIMSNELHVPVKFLREKKVWHPITRYSEIIQFAIFRAASRP